MVRRGGADGKGRPGSSTPVSGLCGVLALLVLHSPASANPIPAYHEAYMASEDLVVVLDPAQATLVGSFVFRSAPHARLHHPRGTVRLTVPVWIPSETHGTGGNLARLRTQLETSDRFAPLTGETRTLTQAVIGLSAMVDGVHMECRALRWEHEAGFAHSNEDALPPVLRLDFYHYFDPERLRRGARISLVYRQPLIRGEETRWLFYRPMLDNLPPGAGSESPDAYRIHVLAAHPMQLDPVSELRFHAKPASNELLVLPEHRKPIVIRVSGTAERELGPMFARHPRWSTRERQLMAQGRGHVIASGDTLSHLARRYGTGLGDLLDLNADLDPSRLRIGSVVQISGMSTRSD